jgi:V/A-type H+-transporting ATPase subunit C
MAGVSVFAGLHAHARAIYSEKLDAETRTRLSAAADLKAMIDILDGTAYGPHLRKVAEERLTARRMVYQLRGRIAEIYASILHWTPAPYRKVMEQVFRRYEIDNLKAVLRGVETGAGWNEVQFVLFPYGPESVLPMETMAESGDIRSAVEKLHGTPYYETLDHAMERYLAEGSLFPLEVSLDLQYWRTLWDGVRHLPAADRKPCLRLIGSRMDVNNLMWAVRYKVYYGLSEEEVINYTLPFGYRLPDEDLRRIAAGADIPEIMTRVFPEIGEMAPLLEDPRRGLPLVEARLGRRIAHECRAVLSGYPFHIGVPLAIAMLSEMETQDLTVLVEAKTLQTPPEAYRPYLLTEEEPSAVAAA